MSRAVGEVVVVVRVVMVRVVAGGGDGANASAEEVARRRMDATDFIMLLGVCGGGKGGRGVR